MQRTESDMLPLLWEGFAQVVHNSRRNGHVKLNGDTPNCLIRQYEVARPLPDDFMELLIIIVFEYNKSLNRGRIRISERDTERLLPML